MDTLSYFQTSGAMDSEAVQTRCHCFCPRAKNPVRSTKSIDHSHQASNMRYVSSLCVSEPSRRESKRSRSRLPRSSECILPWGLSHEFVTCQPQTPFPRLRCVFSLLSTYQLSSLSGAIQIGSNGEHSLQNIISTKFIGLSIPLAWKDRLSTPTMAASRADSDHQEQSRNQEIRSTARQCAHVKSMPDDWMHTAVPAASWANTRVAAAACANGPEFCCSMKVGIWPFRSLSLRCLSCSSLKSECNKLVPLRTSGFGNIAIVSELRECLRAKRAGDSSSLLRVGIWLSTFCREWDLVVGMTKTQRYGNAHCRCR
jgi:hypothetical protein